MNGGEHTLNKCIRVILRSAIRESKTQKFNFDILNVLINKGSKVCDQMNNQNSLTLALKHAYRYINGKLSNFIDPLIAEINIYDLIKYLIDHGAKPNEFTLTRAVKTNNLKIIKLCIQCGATPDQYTLKNTIFCPDIEIITEIFINFGNESVLGCCHFSSHNLGIKRHQNLYHDILKNPKNAFFVINVFMSMGSKICEDLYIRLYLNHIPNPIERKLMICYELLNPLSSDKHCQYIEKIELKDELKNTMNHLMKIYSKRKIVFCSSFLLISTPTSLIDIIYEYWNIHTI